MTDRIRPYARHGAPAALFYEHLGKPSAHDAWRYATSHGYAEFWIDGTRHKAHILACELTYGPRPAGMDAVHSCRNKACFYVEHLAWGPPAKNNGEDRRRDGTDNRGARHPLARLTEEQVLSILARSAEG